MKIEKFNEAKVKKVGPYDKYDKYLHEIFTECGIKINDKYDNNVEIVLEYRSIDNEKLKALYENFKDFQLYMIYKNYSNLIKVTVYNVPKSFFMPFDIRIEKEKFNV
jgi:hypothetical protein